MKERLMRSWGTIDDFVGKTGRENQLVVEPGFDFAQPSTPDFAGLTLKHGDRLIMVDTGEVVEEFAQGVACGEVVEQILDRHTGTDKYGCSA
jgi:hypothetical protein